MEKIEKKELNFLLKDTFKMAWPAVLESFFISLASMIDTMMVSNLGTYAVAAVGLTIQPKFICLAFFLSANIAISALVARRFGQKDQHNANEIMITALTYTVIMAIVVTVLSVYFASPIISLCGSNIDTHDAGVQYFTIIQLGMIFNVLSLVINAAQRGSGNTKIAMTTNITSSIVNVVFNFLLINGHLGFPRLGLTGAALATVLGTVVACFMSIRSLFKKQSYVSLTYIVKNKVLPSFNAFKSIISLSVNFLLENFAMRVGFLTTAVVAAKLGTDAFAAHQVGMNFLNLSFSFGDGMQVAAVALIGRSLGQKDPDKAKIYGNLCQRIGLIISIVISIVMFFGGRELFTLFFDDPHVLDMGQVITRYIMIVVLFQISQVIFAGCLRGAGDAKYTLFASLISVTIIRTIVTYGLSSVLNWGLHGIWLGVLSDQLSRFVLLSLRYRKGEWTKISI